MIGAGLFRDDFNHRWKFPEIQKLAMPNKTLVEDGFLELAKDLRPRIAAAVKESGKDWHLEGVDTYRGRVSVDARDADAMSAVPYDRLLHFIEDKWESVFKNRFHRTAETYVSSLIRARNYIAHPAEDIPYPAADLAFGHMIGLLQLWDDTGGTLIAIRKLHTKLLKPDRESQPAPRVMPRRPATAVPELQRLVASAVGQEPLEPPDEIFLDTTVLRQLPPKGMNPKITMLIDALEEFNDLRESSEEMEVNLWAPRVCLFELVRERESLIGQAFAKGREALRSIVQYSEHESSIKWLEETGEPNGRPTEQVDEIMDRSVEILDRSLAAHKILPYEWDMTVSDEYDVDVLVRQWPLRKYVLGGLPVERLSRAARVLLNIVEEPIRPGPSAYLISSDELFYDSTITELRAYETKRVNLIVFKTIEAVIECLAAFSKLYRADRAPE